MPSSAAIVGAPEEAAPRSPSIPLRRCRIEALPRCARVSRCSRRARRTSSGRSSGAWGVCAAPTSLPPTLPTGASFEPLHRQHIGWSPTDQPVAAHGTCCAASKHGRRGHRVEAWALGGGMPPTRYGRLGDASDEVWALGERAPRRGARDTRAVPGCSRRAPNQLRAKQRRLGRLRMSGRERLGRPPNRGFGDVPNPRTGRMSPETTLRAKK